MKSRSPLFMPPFRSIRRVARDASEKSGGEKVFRVTISGPAKGPKPISFDVEACDAKAAGLQVRKLVAVGRMTVEEA